MRRCKPMRFGHALLWRAIVVSTLTLARVTVAAEEAGAHDAAPQPHPPAQEAKEFLEQPDSELRLAAEGANKNST